ncbi:unnamed protein product [Boreogadus saida]
MEKEEEESWLLHQHSSARVLVWNKQRKTGPNVWQGLHQFLHQAGPPSVPPPGKASISSSTRQGLQHGSFTRKVLQHGSSITQVLQHGSSISPFSHGFLVWLQTVGLGSKSPGDATQPTSCI